MSIGYASAAEIVKAMPRFFQTTGLTGGEVDWFIEDSENLINGYLGKVYKTPWTVQNVPPLIKSVTRILTQYEILRSQIIQEDNSQSQWIEGRYNYAMKILDGLVNGDLALISGSGTLIEQLDSPSNTIWSSTMTYVPTMSILDPILERVDPDREDLEWGRRED